MNELGYLGLDIGGTKILGLAVGPDLEIRQELRLVTRRDGGPARVVEQAAALCRELIGHCGRIRGVGVGFAGLVDIRTGVVSSSVILPGWQDHPLAAALSAALDGLPCVADNDATAAGYGEHLALGSPTELNMVLLTVGTGIGGAILIGGRLYRGATGTAAEFGNMTIDWRGELCWCGSRGCLNTLASGTAIATRAAALARQAPGSRMQGIPPPLPLERIAEEALQGDPAAVQAVEEGARALGAGVANLINIFNPDRVVLTGGVLHLGEAYLRIVREEAHRRAFPEAAGHASIEPSVLGPRVGAFGAAGLIRSRLAGLEREG